MNGMDERLAALGARFVEQAIEIADAIEACLARQAWVELAAPCHSLAGRAGMFGYTAIGDAARAVEEAIDAQASRGEIEHLAAELLDRLNRLRQDR
ncbi:Hpt domain-containing protein [Sphingopyxis sp. PAMC25046]|jgi:HPt (histidine-containing phosphotransfer) domain-containing protein|nr:Hpt domain-containing protein [Sphingopyxis sp. PAMC25046]